MCVVCCNERSLSGAWRPSQSRQSRWIVAALHSIDKEFQITHSGHKPILLCLATATLSLSACADDQRPASVGERISARGGAISDRGAAWEQGQASLQKGERDIARGVKQVAIGEKRLKRAQKDLVRAERQVRDGQDQQINGQRMATDGAAAMQRAESAYSAIRNNPPAINPR